MAGQLQPLVEQALRDALESLTEMQAREGEFLRKELVGLVEDARRILHELAEKTPEAARENRQRYCQRLQEALAGTGVKIEEADLVREIAIQVEKADVTEEMGRARSHLEQFSELIESGGRVGRKLDFLTQEMFREANTMAAKVNHSHLARMVMDLKVTVDRLREQTQNIE